MPLNFRAKLETILLLAAAHDRLNCLYSRDHEPESMDRIGGEVEQMDLFQRFMSVAWELWMERRVEPELAAPLS
ncbi:hypothetical protein DNH61_25665 [Paenibacillus sambharensis]|uniref:Uncharacterized protein n=1 Tax=Paenibacillus sambharensis TaxID=1803190 RepID=A0A2W1KZ03_9BACL|nr:hypothetical protein DNH61_25665 [Paenibacillus sambharensis]